MKSFYTVLFTLFLFSASTQVSFEEFNIPQDSFINAATGDGFLEGPLTFSNDYNATYMSFNNFALSNKTDQVTAGFTNQYSVYSTSGANETQNFAIGYLFDGTTTIKLDQLFVQNIESMMVNNATFPALSMLNGDNFAKKFGGESGNDPDFFLLKFDFYFDGEATGDTLGFFLADFRFEDNSMDYIIEEWTTIDFSGVPSGYDEIRLRLKSSDNGAFGMNTPAYVAIDEIQLPVVSTKKSELQNVSIYPNPVTDLLNVETEGNASISVYNVLGSHLLSTQIDKIATIDLSSLSAGTYFIQLQSQGKSTTRRIIKK